MEALEEHRQKPCKKPVSSQMQELIDSTMEGHRREKALLEESLRKYGLK